MTLPGFGLCVVLANTVGFWAVIASNYFQSRRIDFLQAELDSLSRLLETRGAHVDALHDWIKEIQNQVRLNIESELPRDPPRGK
jgi:hypothetical protein